MQVERWQHVQDLYFRALEMPEVHRTPFLENACPNDLRLRQEVQSLLECEARIGPFLEPITPEAVAAIVDPDVSTDSEDSDDMIGATIDDRYVVTQHLGSGGMGDVYRADHRLLGTPVAIKRLSQRFRDKKEYRERFLEEARRAIALDHENIVRVKDVVEESNEVFVVMEFIDGRTLRTYRDHPVDLEEFLEIATQCASGLAAAHQQQIAHLDIKPANILVTASRRLKICDFGMAWQIDPANDTARGPENRWTFGGTPAYMAPEVLEGNHFDVRADVFSLGVVFYELLCGTHPFSSDDVRTTTNRIVKETPPPIQRAGKKWPSRLARLVERMLSKDPDQRATAAEVLHSLQGIQRRNRIARDVRNAPWELLPLVRKRPFTALSLVMATILTVAAVIYFRPLSMLGFHGVPERETAAAVLPCRAIGDRTPARDDIARGTSEWVALRLGRLREAFPHLHVAPPSYIREERIDSIEKARVIWGATLVVDCTLQFLNDKVTFTYALIRATDQPKDNEVLRQGVPLVFREDDRAFYEDNIPQAVAAMLEVELEPKAESGTNNSEAFRLYQQGLGALFRYDIPENVERAVNLFGQAAILDPSYAAAYAGLGQAYWYKFDITRDASVLDKSLVACQKAEMLAPNSSSTQVCLGRVYWRRGDLRIAQEVLKRATTLSATNDEALRLLGRVYEDSNRFDLAERHYLDAIDLRKDYWASYSWIAGFYSDALHDYKKAEEYYEMALVRSPGGENARVLYSLGNTYGMAGEYDRALTRLKKSDQLLPDQPKTLNNLGLTYWKKGQNELAISVWEKAAAIVERDGGDHAPIGNLARVYWLTGNKEKARETYQRAITRAERQLQIDRYNAAIHILLGRYYAMLGDAEKAKSSINIALHGERGRPKDPHYLLIAATAYLALGDKNLALDHLDFAVRNGAHKRQSSQSRN